MAFKGWSKDAIDFYVGLEADNSKSYWLEHKAVYDERVKAPFLALSVQGTSLSPHVRQDPRLPPRAWPPQER